MQPLKYTITFGNGDTYEGEMEPTTRLTVSLGRKQIVDGYDFSDENYELFPIVAEKRETRKTAEATS